MFDKHLDSEVKPKSFTMRPSASIDTSQSHPKSTAQKPKISANIDEDQQSSGSYYDDGIFDDSLSTPEDPNDEDFVPSKNLRIQLATETAPTPPTTRKQKALLNKSGKQKSKKSAQQRADDRAKRRNKEHDAFQKGLNKATVTDLTIDDDDDVDNVEEENNLKKKLNFATPNNQNDDEDDGNHNKHIRMDLDQGEEATHPQNIEIEDHDDDEIEIITKQVQQHQELKEDIEADDHDVVKGDDQTGLIPLTSFETNKMSAQELS